MSEPAYKTLDFRRNSGVAIIRFDHPPINLIDLDLLRELDAVTRLAAEDDAVRVVVLESADPDFFLAHADVNLILALPPEALESGDELGMFHAMVERLRTMPKPTIAKIEGIARGGGSEIALSCDMRFAARGKAVLAQPEVALGILPGGSGTQRLPRLVGRARALELILGCEDVDADLAAEWGYVNRAMDAAELGPFVDRLAKRIASFPPEAIRLAKDAVNATEPHVREGLLLEARRFAETLRTPEARTRMQRFLELGGQTRDVELALGSLMERL